MSELGRSEIDDWRLRDNGPRTTALVDPVWRSCGPIDLWSLVLWSAVPRKRRRASQAMGSRLMWPQRTSEAPGAASWETGVGGWEARIRRAVFKTVRM